MLTVCGQLVSQLLHQATCTWTLFFWAPANTWHIFSKPTVPGTGYIAIGLPNSNCFLFPDCWAFTSATCFVDSDAASSFLWQKNYFFFHLQQTGMEMDTRIEECMGNLIEKQGPTWTCSRPASFSISTASSATFSCTSSLLAFLCCKYRTCAK